MTDLNALADRLARSDARFDGRDFDALGKADKSRYLERAKAGLDAIGALRSAGAVREAIERADKAERLLKHRTHQLELSRKYWVRAAQKALDGDSRELRLRVDTALAPPMDIVLSDAEPAVLRSPEGKEGNRVQGMVRDFDRWAKMDATAVAAGSQAQVIYALEDAKTDIAALARYLRSQPTYRQGVEDAARWIDKRRDAYIEEHGSYDPSTGVTEFPGDGEEYVYELDEIAEGLRALLDKEA